MERLEAIVYGKVQMVMYRNFTRRKAHALGLVGEVQNLLGGTVRVVAEGSREQLEQLLAHLGNGPLLARVDHLVVEWKSASGTYRSFDITYE